MGEAGSENKGSGLDMTVLPPPLNASRWRMGGDHDRWQDTDRLSVAESMGRKLTAFSIQAEGYLSNRRGFAGLAGAEAGGVRRGP